MTAVQRNLIPLLPNEREKAIVNFTAELLDTYSVSDQTYQLTKAAVQNHDSVLVEIISIAGYYTFVCYTQRVPHSQHLDRFRAGVGLEGT